MAERQHEEMSAKEKRRALIKERAQELDEEYRLADQEQRIADQRASFNERCRKLEEKTYARIEKYGEQDLTAQMLMSLLEVTIQMSEAIEVITSIGEAVATISDAMLCVDETMKLITDSLSLTQASNYGFWARRKAKRNIRRTIDNNIGRMKQMTMMLSGSMEIADMLTDSMQQMSVGQQKMMAKRAKKQEKRQQKMQKNGTTAFVANPNAKRRMDEIRASRSAAGGDTTIGGGDTSGGTYTPPATGSAPATGGASSFSDLEDL